MPFERFLEDGDLRRLRRAFRAQGRDLRLVGGCVRDLLMGETPKDVDLCTDADPDEQVAIYRSAGLRHVETGLAHGTLTAIVDGRPFEVTSLRTESEHDGRHAKVAYTRDWIEDLGRRDLTINAMALTFDAEVVDPFGGREDLALGRIRFVGNPDDRIREDYLRILRFVRFQGRIAPDKPFDETTVDAVRRLGEGLRGISRERVWSEVARIASGAAGPRMLRAMTGELDIARHVDWQTGEPRAKLEAVHALTRDPVTVLTAAIGPDVTRIACAWRWSRAEADKAAFLVCNEAGSASMSDLKRLVAIENRPVAWVRELACLKRDPEAARAISEWVAPAFPVNGKDLMELGHRPGKAMGAALAGLKEAWSRSDYVLSREDLLSAARTLEAETSRGARTHTGRAL